MKYVGARYMPLFLGTYDATTNYEALSVVDNGIGTSYVANKPVPAGTPLTNTNYWSVYGSTSGAIINLQNQIDVINANVDRTVIKNDSVTLEDGNFYYENCVINDIPTETVVNGVHIFKNCTIDNLFIRGGEYHFYNCTYTTITIVHGTAVIVSCSGGNLHFVGDCHNTIIDGCKIISSDPTHPAVCFDGSIADNVKITNNEIVNTVGNDTFNMQCINTHGVTNSVIANNNCVRTLPAAPSDNAVTIDISGHADSAIIRSYNNVIRDNTSNGDIIIYAAKDVKVLNNNVRRILVGGIFQSLDYGEWLISGNLMDAFKFDAQSGTPTALSIHIIGNVMTRHGAIIGTPLTGSAVKVSGNTLKGALVNTETIMSDIETPEDFVYIPDGEKLYIPNAYIVVSDFASVPAGSIYNGGLVENTLGVDGYIIYKKLNIRNGQQRVWCQ